MAGAIQPKKSLDWVIGIASLILAVLGVLPIPGLFLVGEGLAVLLGLFALVTGAGRFTGLAGLALGIFLLVAGPPWARAPRPTSAARAIGDLRMLHSAEVAYASAADGKYGSLDCLQQPSSAGCVPGYPSTAPLFLYDWRPPSVYTATFFGAPPPGPNFDRYCIQARPRALTADADFSFGIDEKGTLVRYAGLTDCCAASATLLPICTPKK